MEQQPIRFRADVERPVALPHPGRLAPRALAAAPSLPCLAAAPRTGVPAATGLQVGVISSRHARDGAPALMPITANDALEDR